jgi:tetratricopeptide (TPR) repeat protein
VAVLGGKNTVGDLERRRARDPQNAEVLIRLGIKYQERQLREQALALFKEAAAADPTGRAPMPLDSGGTVSCLEMANYQYARTFVVTWGLINPRPIREFVRTHPNSPLLREAYLDAVRYAGFDDDEGRSLYKGLMARLPSDPEVLAEVVETLVRYQQRSGHTPLIEESIAQAEITRDVAAKTSTVEIAKSLAKLQLLNKRPDSADLTFGSEFLTGQIRNWARDLVTYAEFWVQEKANGDDAERAVQLAMKMCPDDPPLCRRVANLYMLPPVREEAALSIYGPELLKKIQSSASDLYDYFSFWIRWKTNVPSALEAQESLLKLKPDSLHYWSYAAAVLWKAGYKDRALAIFGPTYAAAQADRMSRLYEYGLFWIDRKANLEDAIPVFVRAAKASPRIATDQWRAARALVVAGHADQAMEIFGPSYLPNIASNPDDLSLYAGFWLGRKENQDSALAAINMMCRLPDVDWFHINRAAYDLSQSGLAERAEFLYGADYLEKILAGDAEPLIRFADFWRYQDKNLEWALKAARAACQAEPNLAEGWSTLAETLVASGQLAEALKAMEKAVGFEPNADQREKYQKRCTEIRNGLSKK